MPEQFSSQVTSGKESKRRKRKKEKRKKRKEKKVGNKQDFLETGFMSEVRAGLLNPIFQSVRLF